MIDCHGLCEDEDAKEAGICSPMIDCHGLREEEDAKEAGICSSMIDCHGLCVSSYSVMYYEEQRMLQRQQHTGQVQSEFDCDRNLLACCNALSTPWVLLHRQECSQGAKGTRVGMLWPLHSFYSTDKSPDKERRGCVSECSSYSIDSIAPARVPTRFEVDVGGTEAMA